MTFEQWYKRHETRTLSAFPWVKEELAAAFAAGKRVGRREGLKKGEARGRSMQLKKAEKK